MSQIQFLGESIEHLSRDLSYPTTTVDLSDKVAGLTPLIVVKTRRVLRRRRETATGSTGRLDLHFE